MRLVSSMLKSNTLRAISLILAIVFLFSSISASASASDIADQKEQNIIQTPALRDWPPLPSPPGTILFGSVRDFSTGSPIPNAVVFLTGLYKNYSTSTDSNGMYFLTSASYLSPQTHKVLASAQGYRSQSKDVVLSSDYLHPPSADFTLQPIPPPDIEIDYSETIVEDIVEYYSPVFYQETETTGDHSLNGRADYITRFDFDGDWDGTTKWVSAKTNPLKAYVYYDIKQTKYYWFIYYAVYHPRDWNTAGTGDIPDLGEHEHDMEAVLLVVLKDGSPYGRLLIAESMAHDYWFNYPIDSLVLPMKKGFDADQAEFGPEICQGLSFEESYGGKHPVAYIQAEGHGIFFDQSDHSLATLGRPYSSLTDWDKTDFHGGTGIVYRYRAEAEEPKDANDRNVSYDLLKIDELWERRNNQSALGVKSPTFEPTYDEDIKDDGKINSQAFNSKHTKEAHPPWTIPNKDSAYGLFLYPIGQEFSDPVSAIASRYIGFVPQPYLSPVLTSPLEITPSPPYYLGDRINAQFTIANKGTTPITFNVLVVGGRDPDDQVADFTYRKNIILEPSEFYNYQGTLTLAKTGKYHFFCAYQTPDGEWNTSIDLGPGLTDKDRVKNVTVEIKEKPPEYDEKGWSISMEAIEFLPEIRKLRLTFSIENEQNKSAEYMIEQTSPFIDDIGNRYEPVIVSPSGRRMVPANASEKVYITSPELKEGAKTVVFYLNFIGHWPDKEAFRGSIIHLGPIELEKVPLIGEEPKEPSLPQSFLTEDNNWKVTVHSYQLLEGRNLQFIFLIENLQGETAKCMISKRNTYLSDNLANVYRDPDVSIEGYKELLPHLIEKVYVTFSGLSGSAEGVILHLSFEPQEGYIGEWTIGPIRVRE